MIEQSNVEEWLKSEGFSSAPGPVDEALRWHLVVNFPRASSSSVDILAIAGASGLRLARRTVVNDEHKVALKKLSPSDFQRMKFALLRDLLIPGRASYKLEIDSSKQEFSAFIISTRLYDDDLSKASLFEGLQAVHDMSLMGVIHVGYAAGDEL